MPDAPTHATPYAALRAYRDLARPFLTWYDDQAGIRIEVSMASLGNAIAKAAGLLRDEYDVQPGDEVSIDLPMHWQRAVWLGACWSVRAVAVIERDVDATVLVTEDASAGGAADVLEISTSPLWLPGRNQPDVFTPFTVQAPGDPALRSRGATWTAAEVMNRSMGLAQGWGLPQGGRLLAVQPLPETTGGDDTQEDDTAEWLVTLPVPLVCAASVVVISAEDASRREERISAERITTQAVPR